MRRRPVLLVLLALAAIAAIGLALGSRTHSGKPGQASTAQDPNAAPPVRPPAAEAGLLPWQLTAPLSREVVVPGPGKHGLVVLGGLDSGAASTSSVGVLDTHNGRLAAYGALAQPTHDAAVAELGGRIFVIGGGSATAAGSIQIVHGGRTLSGGSLPSARADAGAVTIGRTAYVVGGYDGSKMDAEVVATTDGRSYRPVAALRVPVRYPALAALGSQIYVFGGLGANGHPSSAVQLVDPSNRSVRVVGRLPVPLDGAAAGVLGNTIYLAGGRTPGGATRAIYAFQPQGARFLRAGSLRVATANAGSAVSNGRLWIVGGEGSGGQPMAGVQMVVPNPGFGRAGDPGAGSPFFGDKLLIADRGNNRLLLLDDRDRRIWIYPSRGRPAPRGSFYFPDDAFFIHHGSAIISNQEDNHTVVEIAYPSGHVLFQYGHPHTPGAAPGYLNTPDDAYLLRNGDITVADAQNCRIVILSSRTKRVLHTIGSPARCVHNPPAAIGSPNGDTPLQNGDILISEITGSWIDEVTTSGRVVWSVRLPIGYPSDPQQLGPDRYLIADYEHPGGILEFDRHGRIEYRYQPTSGPGVLNRPSLVEQLPSGVFMANDDYNDRMVAIDPSTKALVWQYGVTGHPGTAPGLLNIPDGFDLLAPDGTTPTHPSTG
jgi:hypothetical protein